MKFLIAVLGTHGSGKTEICQKVSSLIRHAFSDLSVSSVDKKDSVPRSLAEATQLYKNIDHRTQVEICFKVLTNAMAGLVYYDVVFVDRLLVDSIAYIRTAEKVDRGIIASLDSAIRFLFFESPHIHTIVAVPAPSFPLPKDNFRFEDEEYRQYISRLITRELIRMAIPYYFLDQKSLDERISYLTSYVSSAISLSKLKGEKH